MHCFGSISGSAEVTRWVAPAQRAAGWPFHPRGQKNKKGTVSSPDAVRDYRAVNPGYGTLDDFRCLVREVHDRDLKVIIDIVANHTTWDSVLMKHPESTTGPTRARVTYSIQIEEWEHGRKAQKE
jgi:glycosidase